MQEGIKFQKHELDLMRQWYNHISDINPDFLTEKDLVLYDKIISIIERDELLEKNTKRFFSLWPSSTSLGPSRQGSTKMFLRD